MVRWLSREEIEILPELAPHHGFVVVLAPFLANDKPKPTQSPRHLIEHCYGNYWPAN